MNNDFLKKVFEQSFLVVILSVVCYFIVVEYKQLHEELNKKTERDETLLMARLKELNKQKDDLYERLIISNCVEIKE